MPDFRVIPGNPIVDSSSYYMRGLGDSPRSDFAAVVEGAQKGLKFGADFTAKVLETQRENDPEKLAADQLKADLENERLKESIRNASLTNALTEQFGSREHEATVRAQEISNRLEGLYGDEKIRANIESTKASTSATKIANELNIQYAPRERAAGVSESERKNRLGESYDDLSKRIELADKLEQKQRRAEERNPRVITNPWGGPSSSGTGSNVIPSIPQKPQLSEIDVLHEDLAAELRTHARNKEQGQLLDTKNKVRAENFTSEVANNAYADGATRMNVAGDAYRNALDALKDNPTGEPNYAAAMKGVTTLSQLHKTELDPENQKTHAAALRAVLKRIGPDGIKSYINDLPEDQKAAATQTFATAAVRSGDSSLLLPEQTALIQAGASVEHAANPQKTYDDIQTLMTQGGAMAVDDPKLQEMLFSSDVFRAAREASKNGTQSILDIGPVRIPGSNDAGDMLGGSPVSQSVIQFLGEDGTTAVTKSAETMTPAEKAQLNVISKVASQHRTTLGEQRRTAQTVQQLQTQSQIAAQAQPTPTATPVEEDPNAVRVEKDQRGVTKIFNPKIGLDGPIFPRANALDIEQEIYRQKWGEKQRVVEGGAKGDELERKWQADAEKAAKDSIAEFNREAKPISAQLVKSKEEIDGDRQILRSMQSLLQTSEVHPELFGKAGQFERWKTNAKSLVGLGGLKTQEARDVVDEIKRGSSGALLKTIKGIATAANTAAEQENIKNALFSEDTEIANIQNFAKIKENDIERKFNGMQLTNLLLKQKGLVGVSDTDRIVQDYLASPESHKFKVNAAKFDKDGSIVPGMEDADDLIKNDKYLDANQYLFGKEYMQQVAPNQYKEEDKKRGGSEQAPISQSVAPPTSGGNSGPSAAPTPEQIDSWIEESAAKHGVDPNLVRAVAQTESAFNPNAVSKKGARGIMQLMPDTAKELNVDLNNPQQNIDGGTRYLAQLSKANNGDVGLTIASYNAGPGAVQRFNGVPPYRETQNYVKTVQDRYAALRGDTTTRTTTGDFAGQSTTPSSIPSAGTRRGYEPDSTEHPIAAAAWGILDAAAQAPVDTFTAEGKKGSLTKLETERGTIPFQQKVSVLKAEMKKNGIDPGVMELFIDKVTPDAIQKVADTAGDVISSGITELTKLVAGPEAAARRTEELKVSKEARKQLFEDLSINEPGTSMTGNFLGFLISADAVKKAGAEGIRQLSRIPGVAKTIAAITGIPYAGSATKFAAKQGAAGAIDAAAAMLQDKNIDLEDAKTIAVLSSALNTAGSALGWGLTPQLRSLNKLRGEGSANTLARRYIESGGTEEEIKDIIAAGKAKQVSPLGEPSKMRDVAQSIAQEKGGAEVASANAPKIAAQRVTSSTQNVGDLTAQVSPGGFRGNETVGADIEDAIGTRAMSAINTEKTVQQGLQEQGATDIATQTVRNAADKAGAASEEYSALTSTQTPAFEKIPSPTGNAQDNVIEEGMKQVRSVSSGLQKMTSPGYRQVLRRFRKLEPATIDEMEAAMRRISPEATDALIKEAWEATPKKLRPNVKGEIAPNLHFVDNMRQIITAQSVGEAVAAKKEIPMQLEAVIKKYAQQAIEERGGEPGFYNRFLKSQADIKLKKGSLIELTDAQANILQHVNNIMKKENPGVNEVHEGLFGGKGISRQQITEAFGETGAEQLEATAKALDRANESVSVLSKVQEPKDAAKVAAAISNLPEDIRLSAGLVRGDAGFIDRFLKLKPAQIKQVMNGLGNDASLVHEGAANWLKQHIEDTVAIAADKSSKNISIQDVSKLKPEQWRKFESILPQSMIDSFQKFVNKQVSIERAATVFNKQEVAVPGIGSFQARDPRMLVRTRAIYGADLIGRALKGKIEIAQAKRIIQKLTDDPIGMLNEVAQYIETVTDSQGNLITRIKSLPKSQAVKDVLTDLGAAGYISQESQAETRADVSRRHMQGRREAEQRL